MSAELKLDYLTQHIRRWQHEAEFGGINFWTYTREAPYRLAAISGDRFVMMIDEFQYINKYIIFCEPHEKHELHLAVEVKNRDSKTVGLVEVKLFAENLQTLQQALGAAAGIVLQL